MIRLGLIGCGAWGKNYIAAAEESGVAKVTHVTRDGHDGWRKEWWKLTETSIDGVIIATPPEPRAEIIIELAKRNLPMMVEKPLCLSLKEALAVKEALGDAPFLVDYVHLFSPAYEKMRSLVRGSLDRSTAPGGSVSSVRVEGGTWSPIERAYSRLWDRAPHDLAMCMGMGLGKPIKVAAHPYGDDGTQVFARFEENAEAEFIYGRGAKRKWLGSKWSSHTAVYNAGANALTVDDYKTVFVGARPLTRAVAAFANAIKTGVTDWRFGIDDSITITRALEACQS